MLTINIQLDPVTRDDEIVAVEFAPPVAASTYARRMRAFACALLSSCVVFVACRDVAPTQAPVPISPAPARAATTSSEEMPSAAADAREPKSRHPAASSATGLVDEATFKRLHTLRADVPVALYGRTIDLEGSRAYLSLPEDTAAPMPAVVVIHEWWGLNDHVKHWADRLAADGYAALAVDLYGGEVADSRDRAMDLMQRVDEHRALEVLHAAHRFLAEDSRIRAQKRGIIGWCFGGAWSLQYAIAQADLDAAVIYYGRPQLESSALAKINAPLLGVFGTRDPSITPEVVDAFERALVSAGKPIELYRYDAGHGFANPSGANYDTASAEAAWDHVRRFFARHLKGVHASTSTRSFPSQQASMRVSTGNATVVGSLASGTTATDLDVTGVTGR